MTRPQIIRADTIDLQDQHSPSAQDHTRQPTQPNPLGIGPAAPHQAAAVRSVHDERNSEEENLSQAWSNAHDLRDEPGSDDDLTIVEGPNGNARYQRDETAVLQNGGQSGSVDDTNMEDDQGDESLDDDMMDKISSSPSIDDEDIDFEFVYALHTFVATVEGQANATKGDTMVLLDDSNSYWWLVRVVKDSSIGYLPAEHIETPTERLARLNKHRNIDLSQAMLGDSTEKTRNPLKKAMKRRNAKQVSFGALNYVEPSDYEYSSDEEDDDHGSLTNGVEQQQEEAQAAQEPADQDEIAPVEPLNLKGKKETSPVDMQSTNGENVSPTDNRRPGDEPRTSDEMFERPFAGKSRNGTIRNTDSFFKDDGAETRKITLTPNLLRDDSSSAVARTGSSDRSTSIDSIEKPPVKDSKQKKEKKGGMFGLFKKKDKKIDKISTSKEADDLSRTSSEVTSPRTQQFPDSVRQTGPQRSPSKGKLQKSPQENGSPVTAPGERAPLGKQSPVNGAASSMRAVEQEAEKPAEQPPSLRIRTQENTQPSLADRIRSPESEKPKREKVKKAKQRVQLDDFDSSPEPEKSSNPFADPRGKDQDVDSRANQQQHQNQDQPSSGRLSESPVEISPLEKEPPHPLDPNQPPALVGDTSSQEEQDVSPASLRSSPDMLGAPISQGALTQAGSDGDALMTPESMISPASDGSIAPPPPLSITKPHQRDNAIGSGQQTQSPVEQQRAAANPPPPTRAAPVPGGIITNGAATARRRSPSPTSPLTASSPTNTTNTASTGPTTPWSDASLRAFLDDGSEIRDMLLLVRDVSGVVPVGPEHPLMAGLYVEERGKMKQLESRLDGLLGQWVERRRSGAVPAGKKGLVTGR